MRMRLHNSSQTPPHGGALAGLKSFVIETPYFPIQRLKRKSVVPTFSWRELDNQWHNVPEGIISLLGNSSIIPTKGGYSRLLNDKKMDRIKSKEERNDLMEYQRKNAFTQSMRRCNRIPILSVTKTILDDSELVSSIQITKRGYQITGMITCNNPYCIHCSWIEKSKRAKRINQGIVHFQNLGYTGYFGTFTMPRSDSLQKQLHYKKLGWKNIQRVLDRNGIEYETVCALDTTFSDEAHKGTYHLHIHSILMIKDKDLDRVNQLVTGAWLASVPNAQLACQKVEKIKCLIRLSRYVSKMSGVALEVGSSATKNETKAWKSMSLIGLIQEAVQGSNWAKYTYREFLEGMYRRRSLSFSRAWPKLEEEEEKDTEKLTLDIALIWHMVIQDYYDDIGMMCWFGESQGLAPFHPDTEHAGRACFRAFEDIFSYTSYESIRDDLFGCSDLEVYEFMEDEINNILQEYWEKYDQIKLETTWRKMIEHQGE